MGSFDAQRRASEQTLRFNSALAAISTSSAIHGFVVAATAARAIGARLETLRLRSSVTALCHDSTFYEEKHLPCQQLLAAGCGATEARQTVGTFSLCTSRLLCQ